ncbi:MAG TPA: methyltransferase domain-containing protein [Candidatus Paceibacterota bacterium]|jgi:SAM-dependent methyltransferase
MFKKITRKNLELFLARHATEKRVLDIGAGGSSYHRFFPNRVAIDVDPARKPDVVADAHELPFEDNEFEIVLCTEVLEHLKEPRVAIGEMNRVLKRGGTLILTTRFVYPIHDAPNDFWRFTKYGLRELFKEWDIIELKAETRMFSTIGVLLQRMAFQSKLKFNKLVKLKLFFLAHIFDHLNFFIREEYGDIKKSMPETDIMPSGYYLIAKKRVK